jgi:hypothetical protein
MEREGKERGEERKGSQAQRARIQYFHFAKGRKGKERGEERNLLAQEVLREKCGHLLR